MFGLSGPAPLKQAVVALDGPLAADPLVMQVLNAADLVVAADGGATRLQQLGRVADLVVGDLDSLDAAVVAQLAAGGAVFERHPRAKDLTDGELALLAAIERGADQIILLGVLGGPRADMVLANQLLLFHPRLVSGSALALAPHWAIWPLDQGSLDIAALPGATLSLVPIDAFVEGVDLTGVRWPLQGAKLEGGRGRTLSNLVSSDRIRARSRRGRMLLFLERSTG